MSRTKENGDYNQYWYSTNTISKILEVRSALCILLPFQLAARFIPPSFLKRVHVQELEKQCKSVAFISTPSVYFSLEEVCREAQLAVKQWCVCSNNCSAYVLQGSQLRKDSVVLEHDKQWESDPGFVWYDFNDPEGIPSSLHGSFEGVLIDPPFITPEVWEKYAKTAKLLLQEGGKIICTTIAGEPLSCDNIRCNPSTNTHCE